MANIVLRHRNSPEITYLELGGEIDADTIHALAEALRGARPTVLIDCGQVTFFGVSGLDVLTEARTSGRRVRLFNVPSNLRRVLEATGLTAFIDDEPTARSSA